MELIKYYKFVAHLRYCLWKILNGKNKTSVCIENIYTDILINLFGTFWFIYCTTSVIVYENFKTKKFVFNVKEMFTHFIDMGVDRMLSN